MPHFFKALQAKPDNAEAHYYLGFLMAQQGKLKDAVYHYTEALRIKPDYPEAIQNLGEITEKGH